MGFQSSLDSRPSSNTWAVPFFVGQIAVGQSFMPIVHVGQMTFGQAIMAVEQLGVVHSLRRELKILILRPVKAITIIRI